MLGERIRELRKKKKMTLEALAGEELTKGMLSLIENNKAKPSMESLAYIAERLGVEMAELLEEVSTQELHGTLDNAEKLFNSETPDKNKQLIALIEPFIDKLTQGYESARLLDIYSRSLYRENHEGWEEYSERAARMYDDMNLTAKRVSISIFWAMNRFVAHDYAESLKILLRERAKIETTHAYIDPMTRLDLDYTEAILHFAVGNSESATRVMENAITFSKENRIFYRINDLYRLAAFHAWMIKDLEKEDYYFLKLRQYGEFADDLMSTLFYDLNIIMTQIENHEYTDALKAINKYLSEPKMEDIFYNWYLLEKGKALYCMGHFLEAIAIFDKVELPDYAHHPFDLSNFYEMDTYKALCYLELGNMDKVLHFAEMAVKNFKAMPHTPYKDFAEETFEKIKLKTDEINPAGN